MSNLYEALLESVSFVPSSQVRLIYSRCLEPLADNARSDLLKRHSTIHDVGSRGQETTETRECDDRTRTRLAGMQSLFDSQAEMRRTETMSAMSAEGGHLRIFDEQPWSEEQLSAVTNDGQVAPVH